MSYVKSVRPDVPFEMTAPSMESQLIRRRRGHALGAYTKSVWSGGVGAVGAFALNAPIAASKIIRPSITVTPKPSYKPPTKTTTSTTSPTTSTSPATIRPPIHAGSIMDPKQVLAKMGTVIKAPTTTYPTTADPSGTAPAPSGSGTSSDGGGGGWGGGGTPVAPVDMPAPSDEMLDEPVDDLSTEPGEATATEKKPMPTLVKVGLIAGAGLLLWSVFNAKATP